MENPNKNDLSFDLLVEVDKKIGQIIALLQQLRPMSNSNSISEEDKEALLDYFPIVRDLLIINKMLPIPERLNKVSKQIRQLFIEHPEEVFSVQTIKEKIPKLQGPLKTTLHHLYLRGDLVVVHQESKNKKMYYKLSPFFRKTNGIYFLSKKRSKPAPTTTYKIF